MHYVLLVTTVMLLAGCSTTYVVDPELSSPYGEINARAQQKTARVLMVDGRTVRARDLYPAPDVTTFVGEGDQSHVVPTSDVRRVSFVQRGRGALQGLGLGLLGGAAAGAVLGAVSYDGACDFLVCSRSESAAIGAVVISVVSAPLGLLIGAGNGAPRHYRFELEDDALASQ